MTASSTSIGPAGLVRPDAPGSRHSTGNRSFLWRAIGPAALVVLWAVSTSFGWVDPSVLPSPRTVGTTFVSLLTQQQLLHQIFVSLARALAGGAIGIAIGLLLGIAAGLSRTGEELFDALLQMLRTVPFLALVPLFIVWFGVGELPKVILIALATMFPMYLNSYAGVRNVDPKLIEAIRCFGLSGRRLIVEVVLPLALPSIMTGLRFSLSVAVLVLIAAEQINSSAGIGYLLGSAQLYQQVDIILICIAIYALLGLGVDLFVRLLERLLMPWRPAVSRR